MKFLKYSTLFVTLVSSSVHAGIITFNDLDNGRVVANQYSGVTISADNFSAGGDYAVAYDSTGGSANNEDSDLEGPTWGNSNILGVDSMSFGNVLIIQENHLDNQGTSDEGCSTGLCDNPDDEGRRRAGTLIFDFDMSIANFGFDLIDVENDEEADNGFAAWFFGSSGLLDMIGYREFESGGGYDQGALFGNNSVNRIDPIDLSYLGEDITRVVLGLGGSGAVDNIKYRVPEPLTIVLFGTGLLGLGFARRRKRQ